MPSNDLVYVDFKQHGKLDDGALEDYLYRAVHTVTEFGKEFTKRYYASALQTTTSLANGHDRKLYRRRICTTERYAQRHAAFGRNAQEVSVVRPGDCDSHSMFSPKKH